MKVELKPHVFTFIHPQLWDARKGLSSSEWACTVNSLYLENFGIDLKFAGNGTHWSPNILDESKFTLFILKYPHLIDKIVYE